METIAPPVVAVIVTWNPGEWFEETLRAFASQDYPELSILVLDAASTVDPTPRVARVLPGAFVRRMPTNKGFGATANEVLTMVEGASLLLFCHDDVAPDPDAVHIMVEESFRSNAGVVAPKLVSWDDPTRLLHVGMAVDKGGAVVDRMEPGEIDHGQHDAVRDVFLAPGGCTLVRFDLFAELEGFDPEIFVMGEDLDLCWRAQILGARVVVAPGARVRHLEMLASGRRALPSNLEGEAANGADAVSFILETWGGDDADPRVEVGHGAGSVEEARGFEEAHGVEEAGSVDEARGVDETHGSNGSGGARENNGLDLADSAAAAAATAATATATIGGAGSATGRRRRRTSRAAHVRQPQVTLQELQRRHELHAALKAYGPFHLARVLPQIAFLALAEFVVAGVARHRDRAAVVAHAWRWNFAHRRTLRAARAAVRAHRRLDDTTVRRLQLHGSARLNAYVRRAVTHGLQAANLGASHAELEQMTSESVALSAAAGPEVPPMPASEVNAGIAQGPATSTRWMVWLVAALVVVIGTRQLFGAGLPVVGQLLPMPSWATLLHRFVSGWQPTGVGSTDPTTPATGILGVAGFVLFGSMGLLDKIAVLGCIPVGAMGMARLTRPLGTPWARVISTVIYLAIPVPYDALATGNWDALVIYAACPWILHLLGQASRVDPYGEDGEDAPTPALSDGAATSDASAPEGSDAPVDALGPVMPRWARRHVSHPVSAWRHSLIGWSLALGLLDGFVISLAPSTALVTLVVALGLAVGNVLSQGSAGLRAAGRVAATAAGATVVAILLLAPWSFAVLGGPDRWQTLAGLPVNSSSGAGWGALLRLAVGPIGDAALAWAFLAAAALPLFIGARSRLAWAGRAWSIAVVAWAVAWLSGRGDLGPLAIAPQILLVPAGVGIALSVGLGVAAFQLDLPGYRFGWRQVAAVTAATAAAVGVLPVLVGSLGGRWDLTPSGYAQATSWMAANPAQGGFRVLWLGDPRVLPGNGWELSPGLAYVVSENGLPDITGLWPGSSPGSAAAIGDGVRLARSHDTVRLGRLLAPYGVRYVVVVDTLAPSIPGLQTPISDPPPADLLGALSAQIDLRQVISQGGFDVFVDPTAVPLRAVRTTTAPAVPGASVTGVDPALTGWRPVLSAAPGATAVTGRVPTGTVLNDAAPATGWQLTGPHGVVERGSTIFGYASTFPVSRPETVTVAFVGSWSHGVEIVVETLAWIVVAAALAGRAWWLDWWWGPLGRRGARRRRRGRTPPAPVVTAPLPVTGAEGSDPMTEVVS